MAAADRVIRPGDFVHCDLGIRYLRLNTDTQQHAYVLKPGETDAPAGLKQALTAANRLQDILDSFRSIDFLAPLALRLYLVPVFWMAGTNKLGAMEDTIAWFGNPEWGLGLPMPALMAITM